MGITITVDSVTTTDAAPTTAPHKLSRQTGKDTASVKWTPTNSTGHSIAAWRIEVGGSAPGTGSLVAREGFPCSDSIPESRCSDSAAAAKCSDGAGRASGTQITTSIDDAVLTGADGGKTLNVYAGSDDTAIG